MLVAPSFPMLWRMVIPAWERACPPALRPHHIKKERRYVLSHGGSVWYGTAEVPKSLDGTNLGWYWGDEARYWPVQSHRNMLSRLRQAGARTPQAFYTTTPAMGWLEEEFNRGIAGRRSFRISTRENAHNLAPGFIDELERSLSPRMAKSIIDGEFSVIEGQVYEDFDEARHVIDWDFGASRPLWLSWDFGIRAASVLLAQLTGDFPVATKSGRKLPPKSIVVFDEVQPEQLPTQHQIPLVQKRVGLLGEGATVDHIVCDPAGKQRSQDAGTQNIALLQNAFGHIVRWEEDFAERHIPNRIQRVSGALNPVKGEPTLYFARGLVTTTDRVAQRRGVIKAMRGSTYPEKEGRRLSDLPKVDEFEHARDTLEYLVVHAQNQTRYPASETAPSITYGSRRR